MPVRRFARQPEPADVHGRAETFSLEPGQLAQPGEAPVGGDDQAAPQFVFRALVAVAHAGHPAFVGYELSYLGAENALKSRILLRLRVEIVEKGDLGHDHDVRKAGLQP